MNKSELVEAIAAVADLSKSAATQALDAVMGSISTALGQGEEVVIAGFGTFVVKETAERKGRNPQTGEQITIPAGKRLSFKVSKALKDAVNNK